LYPPQAGADGSVLIPANRKITQAMLKKVVAARDDVRADKSPVGDQLAQILEKSRRKFVDAEDRRKRDLDDLERGSATSGAVRFVRSGDAVEVSSMQELRQLLGRAMDSPKDASETPKEGKEEA
jgi:hypothetical protein